MKRLNYTHLTFFFVFAKVFMVYVLEEKRFLGLLTVSGLSIIFGRITTLGLNDRRLLLKLVLLLIFIHQWFEQRLIVFF